MKRLFLYGSGHRCKILLERLQRSDYSVCGIVDSDSSKWGTFVEGVFVYDPEILISEKDIYVCVTFYSFLEHEPLWDRLKNEYGVPYERQLTFHDLLIDIYERDFEDISIQCQGNKNSVFLDATWGLGLGGVEAWLKDTVCWFEKNAISDVYLLSGKQQNGVPWEVEQRIVDFCYDDTMVFSHEYIEKGIHFIEQNLPAVFIFSRVNELLLAAYLVKKKVGDKIKIIMVDHAFCDGMFRDILSYRKCIDRYVCVSKWIQNKVISCGIPQDKVYTMTIPVKFNENYARNYSEDIAYPLHIGYAGRLEIFQKRMDILLKLIAELEKRGVSYVMNIAGDGSYREEIEAFIDAKGLSERVKLHGLLLREKMADFWCEQDIAINVSEHEGRPISNMEAMLYGAVPVVTETTGVLDDVKDGYNGFVVPIGDYQSMAAVIETLGQDRTLLRKMGSLAREEMMEKMTLDNYIEIWKKVIYD